MTEHEKIAARMPIDDIVVHADAVACVTRLFGPPGQVGQTLHTDVADALWYRAVAERTPSC